MRASSLQRRSRFEGIAWQAHPGTLRFRAPRCGPANPECSVANLSQWHVEVVGANEQHDSALLLHVACTLYEDGHTTFWKATVRSDKGTTTSVSKCHAGRTVLQRCDLYGG